MKTSLTDDDCKQGKYIESQNVGFIMMINNYNSTKEFDVTDDNIKDVQFYLRYWTSSIHFNFILDCVIEIELLIVDDN
jgi:anaerobic ribonucleoside-triphosphate reductase